MAQKDSITSPKEPVPDPAVPENDGVTCGIVMPISAIDDCTMEHWQEVLRILKEVIGELKYTPNLVSDAEDSGIIQKRIIQNLYENEIVVCDVSGKNPNVMFELGIRLAFDKPTIIIKDDCTDYSFDTGIIEHLCYPRDLTYWKILNFKKALREKILSTLDKARKDPEYSTFLKNFGEFKVAKLKTKTVPQDEFILESLKELKTDVARIGRMVSAPPGSGMNGLHSITLQRRRLIDRGIESWMEKNKDLSLAEIYNNPKEFNNLVEHLEKSRVVRDLCGDREQLCGYIRRRLEIKMEGPLWVWKDEVRDA